MANKGKLNPKTGMTRGSAIPANAALVSYKRPKRGLRPLPAPQLCRVERIISGGQTGVDRAALDFAIKHGIPHGGWCPAGRRAEDGTIGSGYALHETPEADYPQRTEWNVRDSDGTVIFTVARDLTGGSALTRELTLAHGKPCLHLTRDVDGRTAASKLREFVCRHQIRVLNVAGPRLSTEPAAAAFAAEVLEALRG